MYGTDHVFNNIHARKAPIITYKRRQHTVSSIQRLPVISRDSILAGGASFTDETASSEQQTVSVPERTIADDKNGKAQHKQQLSFGTCQSPIDPPSSQTTRLPLLDIFAFPDVDNNDTEVELRIASSLHSNNKVCSKRTYGKPAKATKGRNAVSAGSHSNTTPTKPTTSSRNMTESPRSRSVVESYSNKKTTESSIWDIPDNSTYIKKAIKPSPAPFNRTQSAPTMNFGSSPALGRTMSPMPSDVKKRKRNVVSRLKAANGERLDLCSQSVGDRFYNQASDTDDDDSTTQQPTIHMPTNHLSASSPTPSSSHSYVLPPSSPSNEYNERMEQELADLMRTEFGQLDESGHRSSSSPPPPSSSSTSSSTASSASSSHRPCYVPENAIRAPVTYKRFHTKTPSSTPRDADLEMEEQIQYLLS